MQPNPTKKHRASAGGPQEAEESPQDFHATGYHVSRPVKPKLSIIVPVLNEQSSVGPFIVRTRAVLEDMPAHFEIVFIDDGSTDHTVATLLSKAEEDPRIAIVCLSRNFGKEAALSAGLDHASGDIIIPMDVDLQDPPELIPQLVEQWRHGYDVVYGIRTERKQDTAVKRLSAQYFYRLFNLVTHTKIPENAGDFRLLDRRVVEVLRRLPERNRFMKGLFAWVGFKSIGVPYQRPHRVTGQTKWSHFRLWNFALDGITGFSSVPLRLWTYIGIATSLFAFLFGSFIMLRVLLSGVDVPGYASLMVVILFLGGIQLISIGVIGEYLSRVYIEVKGRPVYIVDALYMKNSSTHQDQD